MYYITLELRIGIIANLNGKGKQTSLFQNMRIITTCKNIQPVYFSWNHS